MTQLVFTASALADLKRLRDFIDVHDPQVAQRISLRLRQAIGKLVTFPAIGRPVQDLEEVRELVAGNYVVRYLQIEAEERIIVLRVWHGKEYRE